MFEEVKEGAVSERHQEATNLKECLTFNKRNCIGFIVINKQSFKEKTYFYVFESKEHERGCLRTFDVVFLSSCNEQKT